MGEKLLHSHLKRQEIYEIKIDLAIPNFGLEWVSLSVMRKGAIVEEKRILLDIPLHQFSGLACQPPIFAFNFPLGTISFSFFFFFFSL